MDCGRTSRPVGLVDFCFVRDITYLGNGHIHTWERCLAAADVHAAHKAGEPAGRGLEKAATLRNRAAWQFRLTGVSSQEKINIIRRTVMHFVRNISILILILVFPI